MGGLAGLREKGFDLNTILHGANIGALAIAVYAHRLQGANDYVDGNTLLAAGLLCVVNALILTYERRHKDPFMAMIVTMSVAFYLARVATLFYVPWSWSLAKSLSGPDQVSQTLVFVALANLALSAGLALAERRTRPQTQPAQRMLHPGKIVLVIILSIISTELMSNDGLLGRVADFLGMTFLNTYLLTMIAVLYVSMCARRLHSFYVASIVGLIGLFLVRAVLTGSRSALLQVAMFVLITQLSQDRRTRISSRVLALVLASVLVAPFAYFTSTYLRNVKLGERGGVTVDSIVRLEGPVESGVPNRDALFERMFARAGYLDAAAAMIADREKYHRVIGVAYLIESAIDNALTPGFDVFDTAKVSLVLGDVDRGLPFVRRRSELSTAVYNSDLLTAYGEAYLLFGYGGLVFLFVTAFVVKKVYLAYRPEQVFLRYVYRSLLIWCFYNWLNSYGMDWLLSEVIVVFLFFAWFRLFCILGARTGPVIRVDRGLRATLPPVLPPLRNQSPA